MKRRILIAIATNTLGAAIIVIGARFPNLTAAIAAIAAGTVISISGAAYLIASYEMELRESRKLSLQLAKTAKRHMEEKRALLLQFDELQTRVIEAEDQYETVAALLGLDDETWEKLDKAELN